MRQRETSCLRYASHCTSCPTFQQPRAQPARDRCQPGAAGTGVPWCPTDCPQQGRLDRDLTECSPLPGFSLSQLVPCPWPGEKSHVQLIVQHVRDATSSTRDWHEGRRWRQRRKKKEKKKKKEGEERREKKSGEHFRQEKKKVTAQKRGNERIVCIFLRPAPVVCILSVCDGRLVSLYETVPVSGPSVCRWLWLGI